MKKLIVLGVLLAGCRGSMTPTPAPQPTTPATTTTPASPATTGGTGAATPSAALSAFLAAAKAGDLQAMSVIWGTAGGPARGTMPAAELEMREIFISKCIRHDRFTVLSESQAQGGKRVMNVQLTMGSLTRASNFTLVPGPQGRWYVETVDLPALDDICKLR